uniref:Uncharacterized protein n=1 Tax=Oryza glumipatula TaxID=40148 RepID=A0A0D9YM54_9ORYZ
MAAPASSAAATSPFLLPSARHMFPSSKPCLPNDRAFKGSNSSSSTVLILAAGRCCFCRCEAVGEAGTVLPQRGVDDGGVVCTSTTQRSVFGVAVGVSSALVLGLAAFDDALAAGLSPEEKLKLCDAACEKELENVAMVTTESVLQYKDIKVGEGPSPPIGFQLTLFKYTCKLQAEICSVGTMVVDAHGWVSVLPREKGVPLAEVQLSKNGATEGVESSASKLKSLMRTNDGLQACSRSRKRRKCPWTRGGENKGSPGALNWRVNDAGGQEDELRAFVSAAFDACPSDKTPLRRHELHALAVVAAAHLRDTAVPLVPHCRIRGWRSIGHQRWGTTASDTAPPIKDMALKASGTCWHCKPCVGSSVAGASHWHHPYHQDGGSGFGDSDAASGSEQFLYMYHSTSTP